MSYGVTEVMSVVDIKLRNLQQLAGESAFRSVLAHLRRGVGRHPGDVPELWGCFLQDFPEEMMGNTQPSLAEWAIYTALTLFALHQQGRDPKTDWMSIPGQPLGMAVGRLVHGEGEQERVARRFHQVVTATNMEELAYHMRGMVQLLRRESIPLDYVRLAGDLYLYQIPVYQANVRLRWGQDFYRIHAKTNTSDCGDKEDLTHE